MTSRLKITAIVAAILSLVAISANANHHKGDSKQHLEKLTEQLELTDEQIPQIAAILEETQARRKAIGDTYTLNQRDEARQAMRELHEENMARMASVLTPEQDAKLQKMVKKRMHRREHRREHKRMREEQPSDG